MGLGNATTQARLEARQLLLRGQKQCRECREVKQTDQYHRAGQRGDGLQVYCRSCVHARYVVRKNKKHASPPPVSVTKKTCARCREVKVASCFGRSIHSAVGLETYCKPCK